MNGTVVKSHGGAITVNSLIGHGTSFDIYLPIVRKVTEEELNGSKTLPTGSESILYVDDEKALLP